MGARLLYEDKEQRENILFRLNTLRQSGQFCDVTMDVDGHSFQAHKAVLACASGYMFELFSEPEADTEQYFKLDNCDYESFSFLVNYAYTSSLEVPSDKIKAVYKMAMLLKMPRAAEACSQFLADHLDASNCLKTRAFANSYSDASLTGKTDEFIQHNMSDVVNSKFMGTLPRIQIDIIGVAENELKKSNDRNLCDLIVEWIQNNYEDMQEEDLKTLTENTRVLYLMEDNTLQDCEDLDGHAVNQTDFVQDYKIKNKNKKKRQVPPVKDKTRPRSPPQLAPRHRRGSIEQLSSEEKEWGVISTTMIGEKLCICVAMLSDTMASISIRFKFVPQANGDGDIQNEQVVGNGMSNGCSPEGSPRSSIAVEKQCSLIPLERMLSPRCGVGTAVVKNKILVFGGHDRGECLKTVEAYSLTANEWTEMTPMGARRGRFDVTQMEGKVYVCGGSDGSDELNTVECYDTEKDTWSQLPRMMSARSSAGVAMLHGKLYVIGGWSGFSGVPNCEVLDMKTSKWTSIAPLASGRSQAAVCVVRDKIVAIGGCNSWNCLNTAELYDAKENKWVNLPPMASARRGAGVAVFGDKLYVIGGSDGQNPLATTEVYDFNTQSWSFGPVMNKTRVNVGIAKLEGRLFAVGGFSDHSFLDSIEYLEEGGEWCGYLPHSCIVETN